MESVGWGFYGWFPFLICVAIAFAILLCIRRRGWAVCPCMAFRPERRASLDILEERFARGEIDKKEFEERRRALTAPPLGRAGDTPTASAAPSQKEESR